MSKWPSRRLNVGCGYDYRRGYVNVDLHQRHGPDVVADVLELSMFETGFAEELVAQDVLEHVTRADVRRALFEWNRVLAPGGRLFVRTTDVLALAHQLEAPEHQHVADQERLLQNLFGTQAYTGDFHLSGFTERALRFYLWEAGFEVESLGLHVGAFLDVWARKQRDLGFEACSDAPVDERFVAQACRHVLRRAPTQEELRQWQTAPTQAGLWRTLLLTDEAKASAVRQAPHFVCTLHQPGLVRRVGRRARRLVRALVRGRV